MSSANQTLFEDAPNGSLALFSTKNDYKLLKVFFKNVIHWYDKLDGT